MNTKQIIETYGDNQEAVIDQLHNDLKDLISKQRIKAESLFPVKLKLQVKAMRQNL